MPDHVLTDEGLTPGRPDDDQRPVVGFFGKLPTTGDFVWRGLPDPFRKHWDFWLTRHIAPLQHHDRVFPPGGLRFRLPSGTRLAAGVILPSHDSADRRFPLSLLLIADGDLTPPMIDTWCEAALALQPQTLGPDALWRALDSVLAPAPAGPPLAPMQLWSRTRAPIPTDATAPTAAIEALIPA
jgi:type VI secretion system protein ImpM